MPRNPLTRSQLMSSLAIPSPSSTPVSFVRNPPITRLALMSPAPAPRAFCTSAVHKTSRIGLTSAISFPARIPRWVREKVPGVVGLWAPDVSFFSGEYHVYYNGSILGTQRTVIGLVTNTTLDPQDPAYRWVDRGLVLESKPGDDFNALDPAILADGDGSIWMSYGSYWTGIKQRQIDPLTGLLLASAPTRYDLASRPGVPHNPIEGASLIHHGNYYYLFVSVDYCCESNSSEDDYKQAVGRSSSPHGPFVDEEGTPMMDGGGTVLLKGNGVWNAPGGGTAYYDQESGESFLIFHAQNLARGATPYQWLKTLDWVNDWPAFAQ